MKCRIGEIDVFYKVVGKGFPILMIHGYSLDHHVLSGCMEPLFEHQAGFQRIYLDLPGMGQTPAGDSIQNSQDMLELIIDFIEIIIPERKFALVGQSYGGYLARGVAHLLSKRISGILLICPVVDFLRSKRTVPKLKVLKKDKRLIEELTMMDAEDFQCCVVLQTREVWNRFNKEIMSGIRLANFSLLERIRDTEFNFDPDLKAAGFKKPTTMLFARHDNSVGYLDGLELFKKYPKASLVVADNAGHNFQIEQEELFNFAVSQWIKCLK